MSARSVRCTSASVCRRARRGRRTLSRLRNRSSRNVPRISASAAIVRFSLHRQTSEQLIDLIALGQPELAHIGDAHAGDIVAVEQDLPAVGCVSQVSILKKVLLPAPFGPIMPRNSPCLTEKSMSLLASRPP